MTHPDAIALVRDGIVETPTWFGSDRPLFGWAVQPESGGVRSAVVLCLPLAEESSMAYRTYRTLSRELAAAGHLALRFDYDGTGDSAGDFNDPDRPAAWLASVASAVALVREWGVERVSLMGMRMGATIAYLAAAERTLDLDRLVLWDPCVSGASYLREARLLQRSWVGDLSTEEPGSAETPSYRFDPRAVEDVSGLAIDGQAPARVLARRTTVLLRPTRRRDASALAAVLPRTETDWGEALGQEALLNVATISAAVPVEGVRAVVAALTEGSEGAVVAPRVRQRVSAEWEGPEGPLRETAEFFGPDRGLFGMRTEGPRTEADLPRLLLISISAERHLGEGRTWVAIARSSAAAGFVSVRMDHGGVGDSATPPGRIEDEVYSLGWMADVPVVTRELSSRSIPDVIGIGLCSSGVSALAAVERGALREAILVNTPLDFDSYEGIPAGWTVFRARPGWFVRLTVRHRRLARALWSVYTVVRPSADPSWVLRRTVRGGGTVTLLNGPEDTVKQRHHPIWMRLWGRYLRPSPGFHPRVLDAADHALRTSAGQLEVMAAVEDRLSRIAEHRAR